MKGEKSMEVRELDQDFDVNHAYHVKTREMHNARSHIGAGSEFVVRVRMEMCMFAELIVCWLLMEVGLLPSGGSSVMGRKRGHDLPTTSTSPCHKYTHTNSALSSRITALFDSSPSISLAKKQQFGQSSFDSPV